MFHVVAKSIVILGILSSSQIANAELLPAIEGWDGLELVADRAPNGSLLPNKEGWHRSVCLVDGPPKENCYELIEACHYRKVECSPSRNQYSRPQIDCLRRPMLCPTDTIEE
jgi:hypothetical protein